MGRTDTEEAKQIRSKLIAGKTYVELKAEGYDRRLMYLIAGILRKEGYNLVQKPSPTRDKHTDIRDALLAGKSYDEVEKLTGKPRKIIYSIVYRMREAGHMINCGYLGEKKTREQKILTVRPVGSVNTILRDVDDHVFDSLLRQPGDSWSDKITSLLQEKDPPERA